MLGFDCIVLEKTEVTFGSKLVEKCLKLSVGRYDIVIFIDD